MLDEDDLTDLLLLSFPLPEAEFRLHPRTWFFRSEFLRSLPEPEPEPSPPLPFFPA